MTEYKMPERLHLTENQLSRIVDEYENAKESLEGCKKKANFEYDNRLSNHYRDNERFRWAVDTLNKSFKEEHTEYIHHSLLESKVKEIEELKEAIALLKTPDLTGIILMELQKAKTTIEELKAEVLKWKESYYDAVKMVKGEAFENGKLQGEMIQLGKMCDCKRQFATSAVNKCNGNCKY